MISGQIDGFVVSCILIVICIEYFKQKAIARHQAEQKSKLEGDGK